MNKEPQLNGTGEAKAADGLGEQDFLFEKFQGKSCTLSHTTVMF